MLNKLEKNKYPIKKLFRTVLTTNKVGEKEMYKLGGYIIILVVLVIVFNGCRPSNEGKNYQIEKYESKIVENMVDKNVKIKHLIKKGNGEIEIEFDEKEIPFEMRVTCSIGTYEGALNVRGSLEDGEIAIMLLTGDSQTVWEKTFNSKRFATEERFDIYSGEYIFRIGFNDVRKGKVKVKFSTLSVIEE
jgi:hypothetical protein